MVERSFARGIGELLAAAATAPEDLDAVAERAQKLTRDEIELAKRELMPLITGAIRVVVLGLSVLWTQFLMAEGVALVATAAGWRDLGLAVGLGIVLMAQATMLVAMTGTRAFQGVIDRLQPS